MDVDDGAGTVAHVHRYLAIALLAFLLAPYVGLTSFSVDDRIAEIWPPGGVGFIALTLVWNARRGLLVGALVFMVGVFAATAVALGHGPGISLWWAVAGAGQSALMVWLYRRQLHRASWVPGTPRRLAALLLAAVASSVVLGLVGGFPHLEAGTVSVLLGWWVLRNTVVCFIGGTIFTVLFHWHGPEVLPRTSWPNLVALIGTAALGVYGTYHDPSQPQSWLLLVPFVWAGLTLSGRGAALFSLAVVLGAAVMTFVPHRHFGYSGVLPAAAMVDLLVIAGVGFALLLALMRDQRARLIAESEAQRRMLELVFDGITDGVIIADPHGVMKHNSAARQILGREIPIGQPIGWSEAYQIHDAERKVIDDAELRERLTGRAGNTGFAEVHVGEADEQRIIEVTSSALEWDRRDATLVLLHDVTAARRRTGALRDFAGVVAHDLRGPLTGLDGWLELVAEGRARNDLALVDRAVDRARHATARMRQVVDDWLTYTVVRDAELRLEPVQLIDVTSEIVQGHQSGDDNSGPQFELDLDHTVHADVPLLRQLIDNLVGNAVKYTDTGQAPRITIRSRPDDEQGWVRVDVVDDGIGIPAGQEELIFEDFRRGTTDGRSAGTGLGLALTRRIVLRHGGRLTASRNPARGSTFSFTLPAG